MTYFSKTYAIAVGAETNLSTCKKHTAKLLVNTIIETFALIIPYSSTKHMSACAKHAKLCKELGKITHFLGVNVNKELATSQLKIIV